MVRKTPQEKKRLSYTKDRRNCYGESPHGARRSIPLNKALRNRANRRYQDQQLSGLGGEPDEQRYDEAESRMRHRAPKRWNKYPDAPLLQVVRGKLEDRARMDACGGRRARLRKEKGSTQSACDLAAEQPIAARRLDSDLLKQRASAELEGCALGAAESER